MSSSVTSADVTIRCRVRKSCIADYPKFSRLSEMKCSLRTGDIYSDNWTSLDSISNVSSSSGHESVYHGKNVSILNQQSHIGQQSIGGPRRMAELYFTPISSNGTPRHSSLVRKRSTPERNPSPMRSQRIEPLAAPTDIIAPVLHLPVRSSSPDPTAQSSTSSLNHNATVLPAHRRSLSRSRLSSPDHRLRAASFFAVKTSPSSLIEESSQSPFSIAIGDILLIELVSPLSNMPSSVEHAQILITLNSKELYEISFFKMDALDIFHAFLCAVLPSARRKVRTEEAKMIDDDMDEPIVHDIANFEANAVEDYFRNESYLERMSRRSTRLLQRLCDSISGISDCSLNCGTNVQQSPVTKSTGHEYAGNSYYDGSHFSAKEKLSLALYLNERRDCDKTSGLELRSSPTLTNSSYSM